MGRSHQPSWATTQESRFHLSPLTGRPDVDGADGLLPTQRRSHASASRDAYEDAPATRHAPPTGARSEVHAVGLPAEGTALVDPAVSEATAAADAPNRDATISGAAAQCASEAARVAHTGGPALDRARARNCLGSARGGEAAAAPCERTDHASLALLAGRSAIRSGGRAWGKSRGPRPYGRPRGAAALPYQRDGRDGGVRARVRAGERLADADERADAGRGLRPHGDAPPARSAAAAGW